MTLQEYLNEKTALLARAGIDDAEGEAWFCFAEGTGMDKATYRFSASEDLEGFFAPGLIEAMDEIFARRASHEPLAYISGKAPFFDLEFSVGPGVLIPRFDTEILVETALGTLGLPQMLPGSPKLPSVTSRSLCNSVTNTEKSAFRIIDLCTGSGCVGITIAHELEKRNIPYDLVMTEISPEAAAFAEENAERILGENDSLNGSSWRVEITDLWPAESDSQSEQSGIRPAPAVEKADLIVSNPPYVTKAEMDDLAPEVKEHEPALALTDEGDGLAIYRRIAEDLKKYLAPGGVIVVEHGCDQGKDVRAILAAALSSDKKDGSIKTIKDYGKKDRVTCGKMDVRRSQDASMTPEGSGRLEEA